MTKDSYSIVEINKSACEPLLKSYHYLSEISRGFKSGVNVGLFFEGEIVGVCIFTGWPVPELLTGCFGLERKDQAGFWELSRLVLSPKHQTKEHNLASWFVSKSIKYLKSKGQVRAILSYADEDFHSGTVYAASNFKYYGMTTPKSDFWIRQWDGSYKKHSRGKVKGLEGEWRPRSKKHRFLLIFDRKLSCKWSEVKWVNFATLKKE